MALSGMRRRGAAAKLLAAALCLAMTAAPALAAAPANFTYQGRLVEGGVPVTGNRDVDIRVCDAPAAGTCFPGAVGASKQGVSALGGVFRATVTVPSAFNLPSGIGWLDISVGPVGGALTTLSPREQLTAMPYAVYASSAGRLVTPMIQAAVGPLIEDIQFVGAETADVTSQGPMRLGSSGINPVDFITNTATRMTISGGGNIGIATMVPPQAGVHISSKTLLIDGNPPQALKIDINSTGQAALISNSEGTVGGGVKIMGGSASAGNPLEVQTGGATRFIVKSGGNVGIGTASPQSALHVAGGITHAARAVTTIDSVALRTLTTADDTLFVDAAAGATTITLPTPVVIGRVYWVHRVDGTPNVITVAPQGADTITGGTSVPVAAGSYSRVVGFNATSWMVK